MRIAIDLDGCLADFNLAFAQMLNRIEHKTIDIYADAFPVVWHWPEHYGWQAETIEKAWTEVRESGFFWKLLFPYPTAQEDLKFLNSLRKEHEIYFLTNRVGKSAKIEAEEWLASRNFPYPTVVICAKKGLFCKALDIDVIVDDSPDNLLDAYGASINTKCILFKRPYNQGNWDHFPGTVTSIREALCSVV